MLSCITFGMKYIFIIFIGLLFAKASFAESLLEYDYEADLYYSNVSMFIDLDSEHNVSDASNLTEVQLYSKLIANTFKPNIFLMELAVHPMPIAGLAFRKYNASLYQHSTLGDFNLVKSITAGFEEPYSVSFFLGRMMVFKRKNEKHIGANRAYVGYLVSMGSLSIKDNKAEPDKWVEVEMKIKGTRKFTHHLLDWSFRLGSRIHSNHNFTNSVYIGARRSRVDIDKDFLSWLDNSAYTLLLSASAETFDLIEVQTTMEKKWTSTLFYNAIFGLEIGYLYYSGEKYQGRLKEEGINTHSLIIRPNISF